jgi:hypothetical protein
METTMPKPKKQAIVRLKSVATLQELEEAQRREQRREDRPKQLWLSDLHVAEDVFQWRSKRDDIVRQQAHVQELARVLAAHGRALDALLVTAVGRRFFVIEGHHRLKAYHAVKWERRVPVKYFEGNLKDARLKALTCNVKDKLSMLPQEKSEAAWCLVVEDIEGSTGTPHGAGKAWSKQAIADATTVSPRTVSNMRQIAFEYPETRNGTWAQARRRTGPQQDPDHDWKLEKARKMAEQMLRNVGPLFKNPELAAMALAAASPELPGKLIEEWWDEAVDAVVEGLSENARECGMPELADRLEGAVAEIRRAGFYAAGAADAEDAEAF